MKSPTCLQNYNFLFHTRSIRCIPVEGTKYKCQSSLDCVSSKVCLLLFEWQSKYKQKMDLQSTCSVNDTSYGLSRAGCSTWHRYTEPWSLAVGRITSSLLIPEPVVAVGAEIWPFNQKRNKRKQKKWYWSKDGYCFWVFLFACLPIVHSIYHSIKMRKTALSCLICLKIVVESSVCLAWQKCS